MLGDNYSIVGRYRGGVALSSGVKCCCCCLAAVGGSKWGSSMFLWDAISRDQSQTWVIDEVVFRGEGSGLAMACSNLEPHIIYICIYTNSTVLPT